MTKKSIDENSYEAKLQKLEIAKAGIEKQFGAGALMKGSDRPSTAVPVIPTGNFVINLAIGAGGVPRGRITEIYGAEGLGKTLLALSVVAECQKAGGIAAYVDMEHALDPPWAVKNGVDWDKFYIAQPTSGEEALGITRKLVESGVFDVIVVDSVAAIVPQAELNGEIGDQTIGLQARLMGQSMRVLNPAVGETDTALIFINQLRSKIGPMANGGSTTSGGRALPFYASLRIELTHFKQLSDTNTGEVTGRVIKAKIVKNRIAPPFAVAEFKIVHGEGFNNYAMVLDTAYKFGLVAKSGAYYYAFDENGVKADKPFGQGETKAAIYLKEHPEYYEWLKEKATHRYMTSRGLFIEPPAELEEEITEEDILKEIGEIK